MALTKVKGRDLSQKTVIDFDPNVTDYTPIIREALLIGGLIEFETDKVYPITATNDSTVNNNAVMIAAKDTVIDLKGSTLSSSTTFRLLDLECRNFELKNGSIISTVDTGSDTRDLFGLITSENQDIDLARFVNLKVSAPTANTNAFKIIAQSNKVGANNANSQTGTQVEKLYFENVVMEDVGSMGIEIIGNSTGYSEDNYINNIHIVNCHSKNTGTKDEEGQGISIVSSTLQTVIEGGSIDGFSKIGLEVSSKNFTVSGMAIRNASKANNDYIYGFIRPTGEGTDGYNQYGNRVIENCTIEGSVGKALFFENATNTPVQVINTSIFGGVKLLGNGYEVIQSDLNIGGNIEGNTDSKIVFRDTDINFDGTGRFQLQGSNSTIEIYNSKVTRVQKSDGSINQGQAVLSSGNDSTFKVKNSEFNGGYFNTGAAGEGNIYNFELDNLDFKSESSALFANSASPTTIWKGVNSFNESIINRKGTTAQRPLASTVGEHAKYYNTEEAEEQEVINGSWINLVPIKNIGAGTNVTIDRTNPRIPVINFSGGGGTNTFATYDETTRVITFPGGETVTIPEDTDTDTFATLAGRTIIFADGSSITVPDSAGGTGLPDPTEPASKLMNVGGSFVEVLEKKIDVLGSTLTLTDGDVNRVLTLPDATFLKETDGFLSRIVVAGQERFLTYDYTVDNNNEITFLFSIDDTDVIFVIYNVEV